MELLLSSVLLGTLLWQNYSFSTTDRDLSPCLHMWHIRSYLSSRSVFNFGFLEKQWNKPKWIFSKKIIQEEYPGNDGKHSKDPTGRTSLCLRALGCSNNFILAIVQLIIGKDWLFGQFLLHFSIYEGLYVFEGLKQKDLIFLWLQFLKRVVFMTNHYSWIWD